jgi:predicted GH43/DUF377 family glycosyl hydrolase
MASEMLLDIYDLKLTADPRQVVLRPFHLSWQGNSAEPSRAQRLVEDVLELDEAQVEAELRNVMLDFEQRHWQTETIFRQRCVELSHVVSIDLASLSMARILLIGSYFCHEYSYAAAALMNPSIVAHPDQSGMRRGQKRFIMSMRAVGEGHISSVAFREGVISKRKGYTLWPQQEVVMAMSGDGHAEGNSEAVEVRRHDDSTLNNSVLFPMTEAQKNGIEDLRLVCFCDEETGEETYYGTYTAFSGREIRSELMITKDFRSFELRPIVGRAGRNKGMALFPRKCGGSFVMLGRQDGKNLYVMRSDDVTKWDDEGTLVLEPKYPWEFVQIGNCGSPILCDEGWLVLTHGVGAVRKYAIGAILLDRDDPTKLLGRSATPILTASEGDRDGYVPNVVYTCGAMVQGRDLYIPFGISDSAIGFASVPISRLLKHLV